MTTLATNLPTAALLAPLAAGLMTVLVIAAMLRFRHALPMDEPNHRSLHVVPIPRSGGLGIMAGMALGWCGVWLSFGGASGAPLLGLALALSAFSLIDDVRGLPVALRFGSQILVALVLVLSIGLKASLPGGMFGVTLAVLAVAWMTNLYNFMDGANGLAGGMTFFGFGFYALAAAQSGSPAFALAAACISAAAAGFLVFNFDPARIFMGDSGSIPLGFLAAAMGLLGWHLRLWPGLFPLLVFSPFIVDASVTLGRRILRRERVWEAHREHYYQRLIRMGLGHRRTAFLEYALMAVCGMAGLALLEAGPGALALATVLGLALYGGLLAMVDRAWARLGQGR